MVKHWCWAAAVALAGLLGVARDVDAAGGEVKLIQEEQVVRVEIDGKPFTVYHFASGLGREYVRPFFYPVQAADGIAVTADQVSIKGGDHPHHRSIWVAQGDVNGADHWSFAQKPAPKQRHEKFTRAEGDTLVQELVWESRDLQPMLKEVRTMRFFAADDGSRGIDLTLAFTPVKDAVTFGDTKEGGLCSVRVAKAISDNPQISTAATNGEPKPESEVWGKKAAWCDITGQINGKTYGIAVLDHPANPRHPSNWHVRKYGLMGANVFGLHDFDKKLPKGAGNYTMQPGETTTFRYRVIIHPGTAKQAKIDEKWKAFAK